VKEAALTATPNAPPIPTPRVTTVIPRCIRPVNTHRKETNLSRHLCEDEKTARKEIVIYEEKARKEIVMYEKSPVEPNVYIYIYIII